MTNQHISLKESPSQTAGPFVHMGLTPNFTGIRTVYKDDLGAELVSKGIKGERIEVSGRIFDGAGSPLVDAIIETWQADSSGRYNSLMDPNGSCDGEFSGWGRIPVNPETGIYTFTTIKPGKVPFRDGAFMAPHISFWIVARGINLGLHTRMYFSDEETLNNRDPILGNHEIQSRISTLIAKQNGNNYRFDIHLQGKNETVFLDI